MKDINNEVKLIIDKMTLPEKASMLAGKDNWSTMNIDRLEIPSAVVTDGPHGVRHAFEANHDVKTSTFFPTGVSFASSWNEDVVFQIGMALGEETHASGCDVLLGPCVNIIRHPLAGRNFESYSEDPFLAGKTAINYINGVQKEGVGTSLKHFALNNQEHNRGRGSSNCDERTMREIYLPAFEMAVKESKPYTLMCSYNRINGTYASENYYLLTEILRKEWGFDGLVMSDWGAVHSINEAVIAGLDLEMGGPAKYFRTLTDSVNNWQLPLETLELGVSRVLKLLYRTGKLGDKVISSGSINTREHQQLAKKLADESITLLKNNGILPLSKTEKVKVAVIGSHADSLVSGGGSSRVQPPYYITPLQALTELRPDIEYLYAPGARVSDDPLFFDSKVCTEINVKYFNGTDISVEPQKCDTADCIRRMFWNSMFDTNITTEEFAIQWNTCFYSQMDTEYKLYVNHSNTFILKIDGQEVYNYQRTINDEGTESNTEVLAHLTRGTHTIEAVYIHTRNDDLVVCQLTHLPYPDTFNEESIANAVALAEECDYTLIFSGLPSDYESEGKDRADMKLLGGQNELIDRVSKATDKAILILQTGAAVEMPWVDNLAAIIQGFYFGQEGGRSIADILYGNVNPSGKLSQTFPIRLEDTPAYINFPGDREVNYGEGIFVGYRYYEKRNIPVLFPFGHGLSYTTFEYSNLNVKDKIDLDELNAGEKISVSVDITNTGNVSGAEVIQLYISDIESSVIRPVKELKGFKKVLLEKGETKTIYISLDKRSFAFYCPDRKDWIVEKGMFEIMAGRSSADIRCKQLSEVL